VSKVGLFETLYNLLIVIRIHETLMFIPYIISYSFFIKIFFVFFFGEDRANKNYFLKNYFFLGEGRTITNTPPVCHPRWGCTPGVVSVCTCSLSFIRLWCGRLCSFAQENGTHKVRVPCRDRVLQVTLEQFENHTVSPNTNQQTSPSANLRQINSRFCAYGNA